MHILAIISLLLISKQVAAQSTITGLGIGLGTLIIIIAVIFSIIWCLLCRSSTRPQLYSIIGLIVPLILVLVFVLMPKEKDRTPTASVVDANFPPHIIFVVISFIFALIAIFMTISDWLFSYKKAKNVARSAFVLRQDDQQQEKLNNSQIGKSRQLGSQNKRSDKLDQQARSRYEGSQMRQSQVIK